MKPSENVSHLEIIEEALYSDYQQDSRVLYIFVPNKSSGELLNISPKTFIFLNTFDSEF